MLRCCCFLKFGNDCEVTRAQLLHQEKCRTTQTPLAGSDCGTAWRHSRCWFVKTQTSQNFAVQLWQKNVQMATECYAHNGPMSSICKSFLTCMIFGESGCRCFLHNLHGFSWVMHMICLSPARNTMDGCKWFVSQLTGPNERLCFSSQVQGQKIMVACTKPVGGQVFGCRCPVHHIHGFQGRFYISHSCIRKRGGLEKTWFSVAWLRAGLVHMSYLSTLGFG